MIVHVSENSAAHVNTELPSGLLLTALREVSCSDWPQIYLGTGCSDGVSFVKFLTLAVYKCWAGNGHFP